jgi:hypothetical protein
MLYKLNTNEVNKLDEYWEFIDTFNKFMIEDDPMFSVSKYRNNMIKVIKKNIQQKSFIFLKKY